MLSQAAITTALSLTLLIADIISICIFLSNNLVKLRGLSNGGLVSIVTLSSDGDEVQHLYIRSDGFTCTHANGARGCMPEAVAGAARRCGNPDKPGRKISLLLEPLGQRRQNRLVFARRPDAPAARRNGFGRPFLPARFRAQPGWAVSPERRSAGRNDHSVETKRTDRRDLEAPDDFGYSGASLRLELERNILGDEEYESFG